MILQVQVQQLFEFAADQVAPGNLDMFAGKGSDHILRGNAQCRHFSQVNIHPDFALASATDQYLANAVDILQ